MFNGSIRRLTDLLRASILCAALLAPVDGAAESPYPINQQPAFGGIKKTPEMIDADRKYVEKAVALAGSREKAVDRAVQLGWDWLTKGDTATAMKRFNQAWLLDPDDARAYWGFAVVTHVRGDGLPESERWFAQAFERAAEVPQLHSDYGRVLEESGERGRAVTQFRAALDLDPDFTEAHVGMLRSYIRLGKPQDALKHAETLRKLGYPVPRNVLDQLRKAR